jgi:CO/xanthine dehydrogenase Mo-binding subunit
MLDDVVRHVGQRVAAVVAETAEAADEACRLVRVDYELLPAVFDPEQARRPGAPLLHPDRTPADRVDEAGRNVIASVHAGPDAAELEAALAASAVTVTGTWQTARVTHAQLETHGSIGWLDDDGRLVLRSSTQVPFLARDEIAHIFGLDRDRVRVHTARLGGGFGGKQEMFTEDLVALAVLRTGRPVAFEFSRADEFQRAAVRHPMRVTVTLGADADGRLTAMAIDLLSDTGAYGNHSRGVMFHSLAESTTIYRVPLKRLDAEVVYTNNVPSGAFRGYGLGQVVLGVESAMDQLSERLGIDPFELRRRNAVTPQDDPGHDDLVGQLRVRSVPRPRRVRAASRQRRRRLQDGSSARGRGGDDRHDGAVRPHRAHERDLRADGTYLLRRHGRVRQRHHDGAPPDRGHRPLRRPRRHRALARRHRRRRPRHGRVRIGRHHRRGQGAARRLPRARCAPARPS